MLTLRRGMALNCRFDGELTGLAEFSILDLIADASTIVGQS